MNRLKSLAFAILFAVSLSGCLASTSSPVGVSCDYGTGKPFRDLPVDCQGR
jgi:hypothetical protein